MTTTPRDCAGVLVVEDDVDILRAIVQVLEDEGHAVRGAENGRVALAALRAPGARPPCVILLDLMMPVMDGWAFRAEQLRDPGSQQVLVRLGQPQTGRRAGQPGQVPAQREGLAVHDLGRLEDAVADREALALRLERQEANARAVSALLGARDDVSGVRWPGVGSVVCFDVGSQARADAFLDACEVVAQSTSFGGLHSNAERRARWGSDAVGEGFIRFNAGIEDAPDLLADLERALELSRP